MRYFIVLSYKGTRYHGWQRQKNAHTIQETIENALSLLLKQPICIVGSGRTDMGVHASYYVAHFDLNDELKNISHLLYHLNQILPTDIVIKSIIPVKPDVHARFTAIRRTYTYVITTLKNPFEEDLSWWLLYKLDITRMNEAAQYLTQINDFTAFAKLHSNNKTNYCTVTEAFFNQKDEKIFFTISANRFLRNMVRSIVGNLVDIGRGKTDIHAFIRDIELKNRKLSSNTAPACGLYLSFIEYPANIFLE